MRFYVRTISTIIASAMTFAAGNASAVQGNTVTLHVTGKILAAACVVSIPVDTVDFQNIDRRTLSSTQSTAIGSRLVTVTVACPADSYVAIRLEDNKTQKLGAVTSFRFEHVGASYPAATLTPDAFFSLGALNNQPIGAAAIRMGKITVDSTPRDWVIQADSLAQMDAATPSAFPIVTPGRYLTAANSASPYMKTIGKNFSFPLDVAAAIDKTVNLPSTTDIDLGGSITVYVHHI